ncbi:MULTISPECIES: TPM domain-containing protein [unclassified Luteimonas]|uniref:TPM domain-containing protein n=1 Tax=unclassified Luteimonas TaxID=2629088 RepID=UPI0015FEDAD0|nr:MULTISPECIES: TPM domain-containing protein [unclassified Luteimonas]MBB1472928.1 TPM domain-containing protein [Luteimonas sp. MC1782]MBB6598371.1 TPM domain-containing protein [Luteimonas sp. MC1825]QOC88572.1 TPM domain-containing protein [Luteimonas sp. MC1825]
MRMRAVLTGRWWPALVLACALAWLPLPQARAQELAAVPALDSPVVDATGTLDAAQRAQLERQALELQQRKGSQLQVLVVASTQPESIEQYTQRVFDQWRPGRKGVDDAVLVVVAKDDRRVRIQPGYGLEGAIPDITAGRIIQEYMAPRFRAGDYGGGIIDATAVLVRLIDGEPLPEPIASHREGGGGGGSGSWLGALFAAFVVATIVRGVFGRAPAVLRGLFTGGAAGTAAWLLSAALGLGGVAAVIGFLFGLSKASAGRYVRHGGWGGFGGGGWGGGGFGGGGGGFGGGGGGGWSGGGGMSGGGGASGSW